MRKIYLSLVAITIHTNTIEKLVNSHEVPILKAIHGDDDRCVVLEENSSSVFSDIDNNEEYNRLLTQYRKDSDIVRFIYRNPDELGDAIGYEEADEQDNFVEVDAVEEKPLAKPATQKPVKKAVKKTAKAK